MTKNFAIIYDKIYMNLFLKIVVKKFRSVHTKISTKMAKNNMQLSIGGWIPKLGGHIFM